MRKKIHYPDWSFQEDAINNIVNDFKINNYSRNLLVIPTGGGKTIAAIRSISRLADKGYFDNGKKALWVVHSKALRKQAQDEIFNEDNIKRFKFNKELTRILEVKMKTEANNILESVNYNDYKLIIIDEAHHSAARTYKKFFERKVGVLGLTATPSRTDDLELDFDKVSYSITFRELEKSKVILAPEFINEYTNLTVDTDSLEFTQSLAGLQKFNSEERNNLIAKKIISYKKKYKLNKVIVFVGTNEHVRDLYKKINTLNKALGNQFEHVGYIYGGDKNELNISNDDYLTRHKNIKNSILVNCRILNEGYDDKTIDAVIMATPTNSILYYMQCIGRVVRSNDNAITKARVFEMIDKLPNVRYKIDNRWLYAEISDYLEPQVIDKSVIDKYDFDLFIKKINKKYNVKIKVDHNTVNIDHISILLFNSMPAEHEGIWRALVFEGNDKNKYVSVFNVISNNIDKYYEKTKFDWTLNKTLKIDLNDKYFSNHGFKIGFFKSLKEAYTQKMNKQKVTNLLYFTFNKKKMNWFQKIYRKIVLIIKY